MNARLRRSGQQKTVFINRLILEDTLESSVLNSLKNKDDFQYTLLDKLKEKRNELRNL
jgi:SNF2 family DNA or RNA helicase